MIRASANSHCQGSAALPNFFLIDQSLNGIGGHHFDYAYCIAQAARQLGWETHIAAHRSFRDAEAFNETAHVTPVFRNTTYTKCSYLGGMAKPSRRFGRRSRGGKSKNLALNVARKLFAYWESRWTYRQRRLLIRQFAADCETYFAKHVFEEGDQVVFAGLTEIELMGLAAFLSNHPRTNQVQWNVLFHFNVFNGLPVEYAAKFQVAQRVRRCFESALSRVPFHDLAFFTTTPELADQYNRLKVATFAPLTYPINPQASIPVKRLPSVNKPLKLTLAGAIRREKGQCEIAQAIVDDLWNELFTNGKAELQIQRPVRPKYFPQKIEIALPPSANLRHHPIKYFEHPMETHRYFELLRSTDIGVLAYDSAAYYARRAGILGEYLAVGRPVIVLGGSWLAEQIHDSAQRHVRKTIENLSQALTVSLEQMRCELNNVPQHGGVITFDRERRPFRASFQVEKPIDALALEFRCHSPAREGSFCQIELLQYFDDGRTSPLQTASIGTRAASTELGALFQIQRRTKRIQISFSNAYDASSLSLRDVRAIGLDSNNQAVPRSAVGFVATDTAALPEGIREIAAHYAHYRKSAEAFAPQYRERHLASSTLFELTQRRVARPKAA